VSSAERNTERMQTIVEECWQKVQKGEGENGSSILQTEAY